MSCAFSDEEIFLLLWLFLVVFFSIGFFPVGITAGFAIIGPPVGLGKAVNRVSTAGL